MLGRQQIAGVPTAISELFKNAHDAYATVAVADFFRSDGLFVLRDDGSGMTRDEFESRWLTLGTENKMDPAQDPGPPSGQARRAVLGEKGIGRLAIAAIGTQVLVCTRSHTEKTITCALLHWGLFALPGLNLEDIDIPILELPPGRVPAADDVQRLVREAREAVQALPVDRLQLAAIDQDLESFADVVPQDLLTALGAPSLLDGSGTHFYIRPTEPLLAADVRDSRDDATDLLRTLVGFADTMTPGSPPRVMRTAFNDHYADDASDDLIGDSDFFSPADFADADHRLLGTFDDYGQFTGTVDIYGDPEAYQVPWTEARGRPTACGPFELRLAVMMGSRRESLLDPQRYQEISGKLERFGGLYVYRDAIRVLPYGNADADFLGIEQRRSRSASDAFFSYRRMFGVVALTRESNHGLLEKAGREGFAVNTAYRQFRGILMNFLYRAAFDFFREDTARVDTYAVRRAEASRLERARQSRSRQVTVRRRQLDTDLDRFFEQIGDDPPEEAAARIAERLEGQLQQALDDDPGRAAALLVDAERRALDELEVLDRRLLVPRPRGLGLSQRQRRVAEAYEVRRAELAEQVLAPTKALIEHLAREAEARNGAAVARRLRFDQAVQTLTRQGRDQAQGERRTLIEAAGAAQRKGVDLAAAQVRDVEETIADVLSRASSLDVVALDDDEFLARRGELEREITEVSDRAARALSSVTQQLTGVVWPDRDGRTTVTQQDTVEALETELEELRERAERDLHLTQLGVAIEVVNHEFRGVVRSIRRDLKRLKTWADANQQLREPYEDLRAHFDHLDAYLQLFTPLDRRLYRKRVQITGFDIERFVRNLFADRLERHRIELEGTSAFRALNVHVFPSSLYPVFVNLVDNALYWLADYPGSERRVTLDATADGAMVVRDTGPGVSPRDREAIFDVGFTRKPGGSGYGLHVARRALSDDGWRLELAAPAAGRGAEFVITPSTAEQEQTPT